MLKKKMSIKEAPKKSGKVVKENPEKYWEVLREIGDGTFGKVFQVKHKISNAVAALKRELYEDEDELRDLLVEVMILSECKHKNIITLTEVYQYDNRLWLYLEFCDCSSFNTIMHELEKPLSEMQVRYVARQVNEALIYLHDRLIIHRDIKADNVLLSSNADVKLADFGVSARLANEKQKRNSFIGSPFWMAPEVVVCETFKEQPYDARCDIWSFGITLIELAQIEPPNHEMHPARILTKILKGDPPTLPTNEAFSSNFRNFVAACLVKQPSARPDAKWLLEHEFLRGVSDSATDRKPLLALIAELRAEVIETVGDLPSDFVPPNYMNDITDSTSINSNARVPTSNEKTATIAQRPSRGTDAKKFVPPAPPAVFKTPEVAGETREGESDTARQFKTFQRTRKYFVDGVEQVSSIQKIVAVKIVGQQMQVNEVMQSSSARCFVEYRKQDLREIKQLQRIETRRLQVFTGKRQAERIQLLQRHVTEMESHNNQVQQSRDQLERTQRLRYDRIKQEQKNEWRNFERQIRAEHDKELASFNNDRTEEQNARTIIKAECSLLPKSERKAAVQARLDKLKFTMEESKRDFATALKRKAEELATIERRRHAEKVNVLEREMLEERYAAQQECDTIYAELQDRQLKERFAFECNFTKDLYLITINNLKEFYGKELDGLKRLNQQKEEALRQIQVVDETRVRKVLQMETRSRTAMFREALRIQSIKNPDEERSKFRAYEAAEKQRAADEKQRVETKHRGQREALAARNQQLFEELKQIQEEKLGELHQQFEAKLKEIAEAESAERDRLLFAIRDRLKTMKMAYLEDLRKLAAAEAGCNEVLFASTATSSTTSTYRRCDARGCPIRLLSDRSSMLDELDGFVNKRTTICPEVTTSCSASLKRSSSLDARLNLIKLHKHTDLNVKRRSRSVDHHQ